VSKTVDLGASFAQMIQMQQALMEQFNLVMASLGVELRLEKIDIEPADDKNAIDFIWRLRCKYPEILEEIKRKLIEQYGGGGSEE